MVNRCFPAGGVSARRLQTAGNETGFISLWIPDFAAQACVTRDPALAGKPVVVVRQSETSAKSTVCALSASALALGLSYGYPVLWLKRRYRGVIIVKEDTEALVSVRQDLCRILEAWVPSCCVTAHHSGATMDVSGMSRYLGERYSRLPGMLHRTVSASLMLERLAVGMAASPYTARLCARSAAPHGVCVCPSGREGEVLDKVAVDCLPGLSKMVRERCADYNIRTIGDVRRLPQRFFTARLGDEGLCLWYQAYGVHFSRTPTTPALPDTTRTLTFDRDTVNGETLRAGIRRLADELAFTLRNARLKAGTITLCLRYADNKTVSRTATLYHPTSDFTMLHTHTTALLRALHTRRVGVRRLSVTSRRLCRECEQLDLFSASRQVRNHHLGSSLDTIRKKLGFTAVMNGSTV